MVRSNRVALALTALVALGPAFTGLEARTQNAIAQAQEIAAPIPVRTPKEFFDYVNNEARRLNQIRPKRKDENGKYGKSQYEPLISDVLLYYGINLNAAEVVESYNFFINTKGDETLIQFWIIPGPDEIIHGIRISEANAVLESGVRANGNYFEPIKIPYPKQP